MSCGDPTCTDCEAAGHLMARVLGKEDSSISNENCIEGFLHCVKCLREKPVNVTPEKWARLNVGITPNGLQIWCVRHRINVMHVNFEGRAHPVNTDPRRRS